MSKLAKYIFSLMIYFYAFTGFSQVDSLIELHLINYPNQPEPKDFEVHFTTNVSGVKIICTLYKKDKKQYLNSYYDGVLRVSVYDPSLSFRGKNSTHIHISEDTSISQFPIELYLQSPLAEVDIVRIKDRLDKKIILENVRDTDTTHYFLDKKTLNLLSIRKNISQSIESAVRLMEYKRTAYHFYPSYIRTEHQGNVIQEIVIDSLVYPK